MVLEHVVEEATGVDAEKRLSNVETDERMHHVAQGERAIKPSAKEEHAQDIQKHHRAYNLSS